MNRIFSVLLACVVLFSAFVGFAPQASAEGNVYFNLESIGCPNIPGSGNTGFQRYALSWKSKDEVPSIPEVNEYQKFFPTNEGEGDCYNGTKVINVNQKYQFPVNRDILIRRTIGGKDLEPPYEVPATENAQASAIGTGEFKTILTYKVTFE